MRPPVMTLFSGPYRAMQILIKHQESARLASWRDPDGAKIKQRPKAEATAKLSTLRSELQALSGEAIAVRFSAFARQESDCASGKEGGDLGQLEEEEMMEEFEEAVAPLGEFELSNVFESESGVHLALRTPLGYKPPAAASSTAAAEPKPFVAGATPVDSSRVRDYYASHVLIKHQGSARQASWRDPEGKSIPLRSRSAAVETLNGLLKELRSLEGAELKKRFMHFAKTHSDCGTAGQGGDLGRLELDEMEPGFEEAAMSIAVGAISGVVDTDSGSHIILRTDLSWCPSVTVADATAGAGAAAAASAPAAAGPSKNALRGMQKFRSKAKMVVALRRFVTGTKVSYFETELHKLLGKRSTARLNSLTLDKVQKAFERDPESIEIQDQEGRFPHQVAVDAGCATIIVAWLIEQCPLAESFYKMTRACINQEWLDVMELVDASPAVAQIADAKLRLPIHMALISGAPLAVLNHLAAAHKSTTEIVDKERERRKTLAARAHLPMSDVEPSIERIS